MKRMLATTALALTLAAPAFAASDTAATTEAEGAGDAMKQTMQQKSGPATYVKADNKTDILASELIGMRIYSTEREVDAEDGVNKGAEKEWDDIGEVNNVVLGRDGKVRGVILGIGGFLGIGEKDVAVEMSSIRFVREKGSDKDDFFLVVNAPKEMLEKAPTYERADD